MMENRNHSCEKPLESWKEIAAYLNRDVRTVIRWEKSEGLPVHRQRHQARGSVFAYPSELEAWKVTRELHLVAVPLITPWRRAVSAAAFALAMLLTLVTMASGPILNPSIASAQGIVNRQVWSGPDVEVLGSVSPDGQNLTFVDWVTGDLAVRDLATAKNRRLTNKGSWFESVEFALFSLVSPDGKQAAYSWFNKDFFFDLRLVGLDGSKPRVVYRNEEVEYVQPTDWSPDGKQILAVLRTKERTNQIAMISVADGTARVLKTLDWQYPGKMKFSPDGRYIAYDFHADEDSPNRDIFLLSTDGSREIPLIGGPANDLSPVWTPDGKRVLFISDRSGTLSLWAIHVVKGKPQGPPELIKQSIGVIAPFGFSGNGSFLYGVQIRTTDVYTAALDLETGKVVIPPSAIPQRFVGSNSSPEWSPDGGHLAYGSRRGIVPHDPGSSVLVIRTVATGEERELTPKLVFLSRPRWSPDGRHILVQGNDRRNRQGLYNIDVQTGEVAPVVQVQPGVYVLDASWSPDGKEIIYKRQEARGKVHRILVRNLKSGQEREVMQLVEGSLLMPALSPDGKQLAFVLHDEKARVNALKIMAVTGAEPRELLRVKEPELIQYGSVEWTRDGHRILFAKGRSTPQEPKASLWQVPASGGEPERVDLAMDWMRDVRLHPDGRRLAFTAGMESDEVWVMENFLPALRAAK